MFPWLEVCRSANESVEDSDALAGESTEATSPAPESGQESPETETQSVPYERFKAVNDKLADALAKLELGEEEAPVAETPAPAVTAESMKAMMKDALKDLGLSGFAKEAKQLRVERKRDELLTALGKFPQFDQQRDVPRIQAKMKQEGVGAINAFKLLLVDGPPEAAPVAHDAQGTTTGEDKPSRGIESSGTPIQRERAATAKFKGILGKDPAMRKALELD